MTGVHDGMILLDSFEKWFKLCALFLGHCVNSNPTLEGYKVGWRGKEEEEDERVKETKNAGISSGT